MIATLALKLFGGVAPSWLTGLIKIVVDAAAIAALLTAIYFGIRHQGEKIGAAAATAKVEAQHKKTVADAVADTGKAQITADAIGARVVRIDQATTDFVTAKIKETDDAIDVPPAPPGAPPAAVDTAGVSASVNALVDRANREAEAADAEG